MLVGQLPGQSLVWDVKDDMIAYVMRTDTVNNVEKIKESQEPRHLDVSLTTESTEFISLLMNDINTLK